MAFATAFFLSVLFFLQSGGGKYLGLPNLKLVWTLLGSLVAGLSAFFLYDVSILLSALVAGLWYATMDLARGLAFLGPELVLTYVKRKDEYILPLLNKIFKKQVGDEMGVPLWLIWSFFRWVVPMAGIGTLLGAPVVGAVGGAWMAASYMTFGPLAKLLPMSYEGSDGREHLGAAFAGLIPWLLFACI